MDLANDTGSDTQSIFTNDLAFFYVDQKQYGEDYGSTMEFRTANGCVKEVIIPIETAILADDGRELTPFFTQHAALSNNTTPGAARLSGEKMRKYLYFATPPGNNTLIITQYKSDLVRLLPAVTPHWL